MMPPVSIRVLLDAIFDRNAFLVEFRWDGQELDGFKADGVEPFGIGEFTGETKCLWRSVLGLVEAAPDLIEAAPPFTYRRPPAPSQPWPHYIGDKEVWFLEPDRCALQLPDLRRPLTLQRRYGGNYDITVLQHLALCVRLSDEVSPTLRAYAAAHDLHEAIVLDIPSPLKPLLGSAYARIESIWEAWVHRMVGLPWPRVETWVHHIDVLSGAIEMEAIQHPNALTQLGRLGRVITRGERQMWEAIRRTPEDQLWERVTYAIDGGRA